MTATCFIVSCEHATARVPPEYKAWLKAKTDHTAYDAGALAYAKKLAQALDAPLFATSASRLLIDANRSLQHPQVLGAALREVATPIKQAIVDQYYLPHRLAIQQAIAAAHARNWRVIHFAAHSFTPVLRGVKRQADIGLLYDPQRRSENAYAARWQAALKASAPQWRVRRNYPYRGITDGLPTALRREYSDAAYLGFEIEINQVLLRDSPARVRAFHNWFIRTTRDVFLNASF